MVRKQFFLPQNQINWLKNKATETNLSASEVLRMVINKHIIESAPTTSASESKRGGK